jgi:VHL beta domain
MMFLRFCSFALLVVTLSIPVQALAISKSCRGESKARSKNSNTSTIVTFSNKRSDSLTIYWLNFQGKRVFYNELPSGTSYDQQTFVTHPWVAVTRSGACFGPFLPRRSKRSITLE